MTGKTPRTGELSISTDIQEAN